MKLFLLAFVGLLVVVIQSRPADEDNVEQKAAKAVGSGAQGAANTVTNAREGVKSFGQKVDQKAAEYRDKLDKVPEKVAGAAVAAKDAVAEIPAKVAGAAVAAKDAVGKTVIGAGEAITSNQAQKEHDASKGQ